MTAGKRKGSTAKLQAETVKRAHRQGLSWDDSEVELLVKMIEKDETTYEMALTLGRSYYGTMAARQHVGFAMRHVSILAQLAERGTK
jgi:hypothetical protein